MIETNSSFNLDVGHRSKSDILCETINRPPPRSDLPLNPYLELFLSFTISGSFTHFIIIPLQKNRHKMGLTNNPNECIEEVDVIIAGGTSHLLYSLDVKPA